MKLLQKLALTLIIGGFVIGVVPLIMNMATQGLASFPGCEQVEPGTGTCLSYAGSYGWLIYTTFVAVGRDYVWPMAVLGFVVVLIGAGLLMYVGTDPKESELS